MVLSENDLGFIHAHPLEKAEQNGTVDFMVNFPNGGKYKIFSQFQHENKIITSDFVVSTAQGQGMMEGMEH